MKKSKYTDKQISFVVKQTAAGIDAEEVCRKMAILQTMLYSWNKKYSGFKLIEVRRLKQL